MASATRELSVTYGGITVGGTSTTYLLDGFNRLSKGPDSGTFETEVVVASETAAGFAQACAVLEAAYRKPYESLLVAQAGQALLSVRKPPQDQCEPRIDKLGDQNTDSGRSRRYRLTVEYSLGADNVPQTTGLREYELSLSADEAGRRRLRLSGVFTGKGNETARDRFDASIDALAQQAISVAGGNGTYELLTRSAEASNVTEHLLRFERTYQEVLFPQGGSSLDDPDLTDQVLSITRSDSNQEDADRYPRAGGTGGTTGAGFNGTVQRLTRVRLDYSVAVNSENVTATQLRQKYDNQLRGWLLQQLQDYWSVGTIALVEEHPTCHSDQSRITVRMEAVAATAGQTILELTMSASDNDADNQILVPAWTGKRFSRYPYDGPTPLVRTVTQTRVVAGEYSLADAKGEARNMAQNVSGNADVRGFSGAGRWTRGEFDVQVEPIRYGIGEQSIRATRATISVRREYFEPIQVTAGTGGGSRTPITPGARPGVTLGGR